MEFHPFFIFLGFIKMASDVVFALRTITRAFMGRQVELPGVDGNPPIRYLIPLAETVPPESLTISSGEGFGEIPGRALNGEGRTEFTYIQDRKPMLNLSYGTGAPDFDTLTSGRIMIPATNVNGQVYLEFVATSTTRPAKTAGQSGYAIAAQTAESTANCYYIDPNTKLSQTIEIIAVGGTPAGDQMIIGAHGAITLSPELAASGYLIRCWIPCVYPTATIMSAATVGLITVYCQGVTFGGDVVIMIARNCSRNEGGDTGGDKKQTKLKINPDANDGTDTGYQLIYTNENVNKLAS